MPHINELIDYTNAVFIVFEDKVLLCKHKKLGKWLPIGGHIELDEDPDEALFRELEEETGMQEADVQVLNERIDIESKGTKFLYNVNRIDIHEVGSTHRHVGLIYYLKAKTDKIRLEAHAHDDLRWIKASELDSIELSLSPAIKFYAREAIELAYLKK